MAAEVTVDPRLLEETRADDGSTLEMRVALGVSVKHTMRALEEILEETEHDSDWRGGWRIGRVGEDVVLGIAKSLEPERELLDLAARLTEKGLAGRLERYERPDVPLTRRHGYLLEARLRVGHQNSDLPSGWEVDLAALERVVRRAVDWCFEDAAGAAAVFSGSWGPAFVLGPGEDPADRMMDELRADGAAGAQVWAGGRTRSVYSSRVGGMITLLDSADPAGHGFWARAYAALRDVLRDVAADLAYGLVKHGSDRTASYLTSSLSRDWPHRHGCSPDPFSRGPVSIEDTHAPDAFALQALGPGYQGRIPPTPSYDRELIDQSTVLEHRDLGAWFDDLFVKLPLDRFSADVAKVPVPRVLADARAELEPILTTWRPNALIDRRALRPAPRRPRPD